MEKIENITNCFLCSDIADNNLTSPCEKCIKSIEEKDIEIEKENKIARNIRLWGEICPGCLTNPCNQILVPCYHLMCLECINIKKLMGRPICPLCYKEFYSILIYDGCSKSQK